MVNVEDIEESQLSLRNLGDVINRQKELMSLYIEFDSGIKDIDINSKEGQKNLKWLFWRIIEELSEAREAGIKREDNHFKEELIDSFHFMLEVLILLKAPDERIIAILNESVSHNDISKYTSKYLLNDDILLDIFIGYGLAGNFLKNKDWKRTFMETDKNSFYKHLTDIVKLHYYYLCRFFRDNELIIFYDKKSLVNKFRIRSKY